MPFYTYRHPKTDKTKEFRLPMNHTPPTTSDGEEWIRIWQTPMFNLGRPTHREGEKLRKWDQDHINYKGY